MVSYLAQRVKILLRACLLLLLYLLWLKRIVESFFTRSCVHKLCFVLFCCSIFNDQSLAVPPLGCATRLLYHTAPPLSSPFLNFFKNFSGLPKPRCVPRSRESFVIISYHSRFVKAFLHNFITFGRFWRTAQRHAAQLKKFARISSD